MERVFNFNAGPGMLSREVLKQAQSEMLDWHETGMSIMEIGHRGPEFKRIADQAESDLRELMSIPNHYHVLFLAGGATTQFAMVPLNLMTENRFADYVDTGIWSKKAIDEAKHYGDVNVAANTIESEKRFSIPPQKEWQLNPKASYLHYTPNETIQGIAFHWVPQVDVPLVADMSSMILSQPIDVNEYGIIYAGAQKNIGQAGITVVIIRDDLVGPSMPMTPTLYQYKLHVDNRSFYNTPPTYAWYIAGLTFAWMKRHGGVAKFYAANQRKANKLYQFIDQHAEFYRNDVQQDCRSLMNVPFSLQDESLTETFLQESTRAGLVNLKGHRLAGGLRASIYNAMPEEGVDALVRFMQEFAKRYGK